MSISRVVIGLFLFLFCVKAEIPDGYIMQIKPTCGNSWQGSGWIKLVTDLDADAKAVCKDGEEFNFVTDDEVNFQLNFTYQGASNASCVFSNRNNSKVFFAKLFISYGEPDNEVHQYSEEFTVTCSFDKKANNDSASHTVSETLIAPKEIQTNMGNRSSSPVDLKIVDVLHNDLKNITIHLGRLVRLQATVNGSEGGLRPVSCFAIDSSMKRYAILRAGCGDGIVLQKDEGFETKGKETLSPYFKAFHINTDTTVKFECNFTLCQSPCDGNSCALHSSRRKRDDVPVSHITEYRIEMDPQRLVNADTEPLIIDAEGMYAGVARVERSQL